MEFKDYYATLGVAKTATDKEIKQAFRKLARKHHPDVNPGDKGAEAKFKEINEAYEVLGDPEKRRKYDELGANWRMYEQAQQQGQALPAARRSAAAGRRRGGAWTINMGGPAAATGRCPKTRCGTCSATRIRSRTSSARSSAAAGRAKAPGGRGGGRAPRTQKGRDIESEAELTLEEAYHGAMRRISITLGGHARSIDVRIPAGVKDGSRVRAAGEGEAGASGGAVGRPVPARPAQAASGVRAQGGRPLHEGRAAGDDRRARRRGAGARRSPAASG